MEGNDFDVIVVGAGMAGVACAGELVGLGLRPLLVCETPEVGWNMRGVTVDGNTGYVQHPQWAVAWGGGWWYGLARRLNASLTFTVAPPVDFTILGSGVIHELPCSPSAAGLADLISQLSPVPIDQSMRDGLEEILRVVLDIPWQELVRMTDVPLTAWLDDHNADPLLQMLLMVMVAQFAETEPAIVAEHFSVFGTLGLIRSMMCGEAPVVVPHPDPQLGLVVPMAEAVEANGGTIWRRAKVRRVAVDHDRAAGIELEDGTRAHGRAVALATGTSRVPALLQAMPPEVEAAVSHARKLTGEDVCTYTVLGAPVVNIDRYTVVADANAHNLAFLFPMHALAPRVTQPGKQYLVAQAFYTTEQIAAIGGRDGAVKALDDLCEQLFPGFLKARQASTVSQHRHLWFAQLLHGPKLPSRASTVKDLWFAGDGSTPLGGHGVEAAASAGILRARQIAEDLSTHRPGSRR